MDYSEKGDIELLQAVHAYLNSDSLANILSMSDLTRYYRVFADSKYSSSFFVFISKDCILEFKKLGNGLYGFDADNGSK